MTVPTICPACWSQDAEPVTEGGGCIHYWQDRATALHVALEDLAGEVGESSIASYEQPALFDSWMRATATLQGGQHRAPAT